MENSGRDGGVSSTRRTSKRLEYEALTGLLILEICKKCIKKNVNAIYSIIFYVLKSSSYYFWNQLSLNYLQPVYSLLMKYNISKQLSPHSFFFQYVLKIICGGSITYISFIY